MRNMIETFDMLEDWSYGSLILNKLSDSDLSNILVALEKQIEYNKLEKQGLLLKLPVVIGQTVYTNYSMQGWYFRDNNRPYQAKVVFIGLNNSEEDGGGYINISFEKEGRMMQFRFSDIGKMVFLTKEEAEKNLAELNDTIVYYI